MATPYTVRAFQGWLVRSRREWRGAVLFSVVGPLFYLGALGTGLGSLISRNDPSALDGVPYAEFVAPGLLAAAAMQTAVGEATWPVLGAVKWQRSYFAMLATPLSVASIFYGHLLLMAVRVALSTAAFALAMAVFGFGLSPLTLLAVPAAALTGMAFAAPLAAWSIARESDSDFAGVYRAGIMPLFLFSGTFFPISQLPDPMEAVAWLTPLWHGVDLCRGLYLGDLAPGTAAAHVVYLVVMLVLGLAWGRRSYARVLRT